VQSEQFLDYEEAAHEDRCALRVPVSILAMLDYDGRQLPIFVTDLGLAGFAGKISEQLTVGAACRLRLPSIMPIRSLVTWSEAGLVGCSLERLLNSDTFDSLLAQWRDVDGR
jgi:hypothetical protein